MQSSILNSTEATMGGVITLSLTGLIQVYEWLTMENINDFLEFGIACGGAVFLFYKIKGQILDNKIKRKQLKDEA
jgi:hypothetical protein